jgi:hypothetical protein
MHLLPLHLLLLLLLLFSCAKHASHPSSRMTRFSQRVLYCLLLAAAPQ